jgi:hypothetical protein
MLAELEQESRLMRARNARLEAEVTVLTEMVRVLSDKIAEREQHTWVGLTSEDYNEIFEKARTGEHAVQLAEAKLKEKNT